MRHPSFCYNIIIIWPGSYTLCSIEDSARTLEPNMLVGILAVGFLLGQSELATYKFHHNFEYCPKSCMNTKMLCTVHSIKR